MSRLQNTQIEEVKKERDIVKKHNEELERQIFNFEKKFEEK